MQEIRNDIIKYIKKYRKLIDSQGMTLGGLHKLLLEDGIQCSRTYVYYVYKTKETKKPKSKK